MDQELSNLIQAHRSHKISRRTFMKGALALGLSTGAASSLIAACAPQPAPATAAPTAAPTPVPPTPKPPEDITLQVTAWVPAVPVLEKSKEDFASKHPGVTYEVVDRGAIETHDALTVAMAAGQGLPDVSLILYRFFDNYLDGLMDLTSAMDKYKDQFAPGSLDIVSRGGRVYGFPSDVCKSWVYYRRDIFEEAGVKAEDIVTWDDYIAAGKEITSGDRYMLSISHPHETYEYIPWAFMYLASRGGNIFDPDTAKVIRNNELAADTLQWWGDLHHKHKIASLVPLLTPSWTASIAEGKVATVPLSTWAVAVIKNANQDLAGKWGVMPWPTWGPGEASYCGAFGGSAYAVPKGAPNPEKAIELVEYITTDPVALKNCAVDQGVPAYLPGLEHMAFKEPDPFYADQVLMDVYYERDLPPFYKLHTSDALEVATPEMQAYMEGDKTAAEAWAAIEEGLVAKGYG